MSENEKWRIKIERKAEKQIMRLALKDRARVLYSIRELAQAENPSFVTGVKHLQNSDPKQWRQRQGDYRIIFSLETGEVVEMNHTYTGRLIIHEIAIHHTGY